MIVTLTMNPAIDKTAEIDCLRPHQLHRLAYVSRDIGGKGINVSRTIGNLGGKSTACGFLAGQSGQIVAQTLHMIGADKISQDFIFVDGETRTNLKIVEKDGSLTEFNEQGPLVSERQLEALVNRLESYANPDTLFVLAGSVGRGVPEDFYRRLIERLRPKGARIFLDADGKQFSNALEATPDIIKPNAFELSQYFGHETEAEEPKLIEYGRQLNKGGIGLVCISMGSRGALFVCKEQVYRAEGIRVEAHSSVGAGDAMVAAIALGLDSKMPFEDCLRLSVATSAAAVMTVGTKPPDPETVNKLRDLVKLNRTAAKDFA